MKIINLGLPKTGTTSLERVLLKKGYRVCHGPYPIALNGKTTSQQLDEIDEKYDALLEWVGLFPIDVVLSKWPDAIYLNTVRAYPDWIDSCRRHFRASPSKRVRQCRMLRFGTAKFDKSVMADFFDDHIANMNRIVYGEGIIKVRNLYVTTGDTINDLDSIIEPHKAIRQFPHARKGRR